MTSVPGTGRNRGQQSQDLELDKLCGGSLLSESLSVFCGGDCCN